VLRTLLARVDVMIEWLPGPSRGRRIGAMIERARVLRDQFNNGGFVFSERLDNLHVARRHS
jgi:hypothetical protein